MTLPHTPSPETVALAVGAVADPTQRALTELLAAVATLLPPGMIEALAAAAADVVAETRRLEACEAEAAAARERERDDEVAALRAAARAAESASDRERAARIVAEDAVRVLRARTETLRSAIVDIGARAATIVALDAEAAAVAQAPGDGDGDGDGNDADGRERPAPPTIPRSGKDGQPVCRSDLRSGAAAVAGQRDRIGNRAPRLEATAPQ